MDELSGNRIEKRKFGFRKEERLCSKKVIDKLFTDGESFVVYPLKIVFLKSSVPLKSPVQAAFTVGKRNYRRAVHRNLIKRKIKEAYRLNKHILYDALQDAHVAVFVIFIGKSIPDFKQVEEAMKHGIEKLIKAVNKKNKNT